MLRTTDLLWILLLPLYQIVGTIRHEGSHALAALAEGARVSHFVFLPSIQPQEGLLWGYVSYTGATTWFTTAAPYFVDLLTFLVFFGICFHARSLPHWLWLNLVVVGIISPLVNSAYNYQGGFWRPANDVAQLFRQLPGTAVHLYFVATIVLYAAGLVVLLRHNRMAAGG